MLNTGTNDLIAISLYNDLVATLDEMRKEKNCSISDLIEGYSLAREMVEHFFTYNLLGEQRYNSLEAYLHYCIDCPTTHTISLQVLQLGIKLT